jgi:hypothetical protein
MTLQQATEMMHSALRGEDLNALGQALKVRKAALEAGDPPTLEDFQAGEFALAALAAMKRRWAAESARLEQVRTGLASTLENRGGAIATISAKC